MLFNTMNMLYILDIPVTEDIALVATWISHKLINGDYKGSIDILAKEMKISKEQIIMAECRIVYHLQGMCYTTALYDKCKSYKQTVDAIELFLDPKTYVNMTPRMIDEWIANRPIEEHPVEPGELPLI